MKPPSFSFERVHPPKLSMEPENKGFQVQNILLPELDVQVKHVEIQELYHTKPLLTSQTLHNLRESIIITAQNLQLAPENRPAKEHVHLQTTNFFRGVFTVTFIGVHTLLGTVPYPIPRKSWQWFSLSQGGICDRSLEDNHRKNGLYIQGSLHYQPKQCMIYYFREIPPICHRFVSSLIPPKKGSSFNDPWHTQTLASKFSVESKTLGLDCILTLLRSFGFTSLQRIN